MCIQGPHWGIRTWNTYKCDSCSYVSLVHLHIKSHFCHSSSCRPWNPSHGGAHKSSQWNHSRINPCQWSSSKKVGIRSLQLTLLSCAWFHMWTSIDWVTFCRCFAYVCIHGWTAYNTLSCIYHLRVNSAGHRMHWLFHRNVDVNGTKLAWW